jgi:hypothetical protein
MNGAERSGDTNIFLECFDGRFSLSYSYPDSQKLQESKTMYGTSPKTNIAQMNGFERSAARI